MPFSFTRRQRPHLFLPRLPQTDSGIWSNHLVPVCVGLLAALFHFYASKLLPFAFISYFGPFSSLLDSGSSTWILVSDWISVFMLTWLGLCPRAPGCLELHALLYFQLFEAQSLTLACLANALVWIFYQPSKGNWYVQRQLKFCGETQIQNSKVNYHWHIFIYEFLHNVAQIHMSIITGSILFMKQIIWDA